MESDRMPRLFYGNFAFEDELSGRAVSGGGRRTATELAAVWIALSEPGDLAWFSGAVNPRDWREAEQLGLTPPACVSSAQMLRRVTAAEPLDLYPWGWSNAAVRWGRPWGWSEVNVRWGRGHGLTMNPPPLEVVRRANSRRFSSAMEQRLGVAPDEAALVTSLPELQAALGPMAQGRRWVVKADFSTAARDRLLGDGPTLSASVETWAGKRLARGEAVAFEPWLDRIAEAGVQIEVPPPGDGEPRCVGVTPLLTGPDGRYLGSRFDIVAADEHDWTAAVSAGLRVAAELQRDGYFGPLGIDAMLFRREDGSVHCRPLQDVNARWTMGRLALGFCRVLRAGERGSWLHIRWPDDLDGWIVRLRERLPAGVRCVPTSPRHIGGEPVRHGTLLLIAPDDETRHAAERIALASGS
jgi:hypothetical protein